MSQTVITSPNGNPIPVDDLAVAIGSTGSLVTTLTVQYPDRNSILQTYVKTITYVGTQPTNISQWIQQ